MNIKNKVCKVLFITPEWQTVELPENATFLKTEVTTLEKFGVSVDVFHFISKKNLLNYISAWVEVRKMIDQGDYNIVHAQWGQSALLAIPKKIPLVITHRGGDLEGIVDRDGNVIFIGRILRLVSQIVGLFADKVILVSETLAKYLWIKSYEVIPVCLDTNRFRPMDKNECRIRLGLEIDKKYILFPSNPSRLEKRYWLANKSCELARENVELLVLQNVPHEQMPIYMNAVDVLLITSKYEGSPTVVFEALACNLPIISVNVGDVQTRIRDLDGCWLCTDDDPKTISMAIDQVIQSGKRLESSMMLGEFSAENFARRMISLYEEVIGG